MHHINAHINSLCTCCYLSPCSSYLSDGSRPSTPPIGECKLSISLFFLSIHFLAPSFMQTADIKADLNEIMERFSSPTSPYSKFMNKFVQGPRDLPVTEGNIPGLPTVGKRGFKRPRTAPSLMFFKPSSLARPGVTSNCSDEKIWIAIELLSRSRGCTLTPAQGITVQTTCTL